jgi:dihydrofolate reductase
MSQRKLILYIAMSLDGYIAKENDDLAFLDMVAEKGQDYGYADFVKTIDTVIMGRKTYDKVSSFGIDLSKDDQNKTYIITRTPKPSKGSLEFYSGDLKELVDKLKKERGKNIYCDGGAEIVNELMKYQLIDEYIISIIPIFLGDGVRLFKDGRPEQSLKLNDSKSFNKGLVQLHYISEFGLPISEVL